ncbi:MAG: hypothetical protein IT317_01520 [Anaerolineales bacterium]|nr:hypothetical protein [Anaerolineales bacterium]
MRRWLARVWQFALLEPWERNLFRAFVVLSLLSFPPMIADTLHEAGLRGDEFTANVLGTLQGYFSLFGIFVYARRRRTGLIPARRLTRAFLLISLALGAVLAVVLTGLVRGLETGRLARFGLVAAQVTRGEWRVDMTPGGIELVVGDYLQLVAVLLGAGSVGFFVMLWMLTTVAFGLCWLLSVALRALMPYVLHGVADITPTLALPLMAADKRGFGWAYALRWLFRIPDVLDTRALAMEPDAPRAAFPWRAFGFALGWQALLSAILGVNVGLNPMFLSDTASLERRMALASSVSLVIPVLVLLWFVFQRLHIIIEGPARAFALYDGLRARTYDAIVAFGTLVLFVRLAVRDVPLDYLLLTFSGYFFQIMMLNALITAVYFNWFEGWLLPVLAARLAADPPTPKGECV